VHKARIFYRTHQSVFSCSGPSRFLSKFKIDGSYYPWTYSKKSTPVVLLVCMKSVQRSPYKRASLRKADAKVVLMHFPTKQKHKYFSEYFVNKYNSLETKEVRQHGHTSYYIYACENYSAAGASAAGASSTGASAAGAAAFSAAGLRERRVLAAFFTVLAIFSS